MKLRLPVLFVGLAIGAAAFAAIDPRILGLFHDDGIYAVVAKALAQGDGYRIVSLPGEPAQTKYPFVYAALLALIWRLAPEFPASIVFLKSLNVVILLGIFFTSVVYYRRSSRDERILAPLVFGAIVCINPLVFSYTDYVLSELLLVLLSVTVLALGSRSEDARATASRAKFLAPLASFACLTRMAALPLAVAGAAQAYLSRGMRGLLWFVAVLSALVAPWLVWTAYWGGGKAGGSLFDYYIGYDFTGGRLGSAVGLADIVGANARYLADAFEMLYLTQLIPGLALFLASVTALGMFASLRREALPAWSFLLASVALFLLWPFQPARYCVPLVPLLVRFLFGGVEFASQRLQQRLGLNVQHRALAKLVWAPVALVLALNLFWLGGFVLSNKPHSTRGIFGSRMAYAWSGFTESFTWIRANTEADALLATAYDPMYFLYTGRKAIRPALHRPATYFYPYGKAQPDVGTAAEIQPQLVALGVKYLIIDPLEGYAERQTTLRLMDELVLAYGDSAQLVFTSADNRHRIYRLDAR